MTDANDEALLLRLVRTLSGVPGVAAIAVGGPRVPVSSQPAGRAGRRDEIAALKFHLECLSNAMTIT
jgi:hypothetical protein